MEDKQTEDERIARRKRAEYNAERIANFFEGFGAMFDPESRKTVINKIANIILDT
jgi:hypothetical protein